MQQQNPTDIVVKQIAIADLDVGMFIEDVFDSRGVLLHAANLSITDHQQIELLKRRGVSSVFINIQKGTDVKPEPAYGERLERQEQQLRLAREAAYYRELEKAREIHRQTMARARSVLDSIRQGKKFPIHEVRSSAEDMVESILRNPDALISLSQIKGYDEYTYTHSVGVGILATSLAAALGYTGETLVEIGMGGILHDIGKLRISEQILNKPGKLTDAEFDIVKQHPDFGLELVENRRGISDVSRAVIGQHHERYNGSGYPRRLKADQIHEVGLVGAVADVYDALTSDRVYKEAWTPQKALATIFQGCDKEYSRMVVERFTKLLGVFPVGSFVKLTSGEMGVVVRVDRGNLLAPALLLLFDAEARRLDQPRECDLAALHTSGPARPPQIEMSLDPKAFGIAVADYIQDRAG